MLNWQRFCTTAVNCCCNSAALCQWQSKQWFITRLLDIACCALAFFAKNVADELFIRLKGTGWTPLYLMAFEGVQDGEVSWVLQSEYDDFAGVVKSWSSCYEQASIFGRHHRRHSVPWSCKTQPLLTDMKTLFLTASNVEDYLWCE